MKENIIKDRSYQFALRIVKLCLWLRDSEILNTEQSQDIIFEAEEIVKILTCIIKTGQNNAKV